MRKLFIILCVLVLSGCMTDNQLKESQAFYEAKVAIAQARQSQLFYRMTPAVPGKPIIIDNANVELFAPPQGNDSNFAQFQHRDFTPSYVNTGLQALMPLSVLYGGSLLLKEGGHGTSYNQSVSGTGNKASWAGGNVLDSTSVPTIVTQPAPIIVDPVIVP
jgi:hypothetical protein